MNNQDPQTAIDYNLYPSSARPSGLQVPQPDLEIKALKEQVESLEKQCAAMRAAITIMLDNLSDRPQEKAGTYLAVEAGKLALSATAGHNYKSPEEVAAIVDQPGCSYAGPGRGDCAHFIGLPGKSIQGQHDGADDTVDVYGKPNGWCWSCWKDHQLTAHTQALKVARSLLEHAIAWNIMSRPGFDQERDALLATINNLL